MAYVIGVDLGTSGTKTVLFNEKGKCVASDLYTYPLYQPCVGWAEQDPEDWWTATYTTIKNCILKSGINPKDVKGIGLSGQMHGLVMLDKEDKVIRKSIIWCDQRTEKECVEITEKVGEKRLIEITANPALTGFTASKIMWVKNNEPGNYEKCRKILLPKDYVRYMLTGEFATEVSDASGMQLLDVPKRTWSDEVLDKLDIDRSLLGKMYESCEVTGTLTQKAASLTGLSVGTPVVGGAGDQAAGGVGNGIVRSGVVSATIGTSGVVFAHTDHITIDPKGRVHTFCHAVPGTWHVMGVTQSAGLSIKWFRDNFCAAEEETARWLGKDAYYLMDKEADTVPAGCEGLLYLPYLMGERTPHLDPNARGVFFGLSARHGKKEMLRSVMEGVSYSLVDCMNIIRDMGLSVSEVRASGGGGKSRLRRQMLADMFHLNISTTNSSEGPALGVALLAAVGAGIYKSVPEACDATITTVSTQSPIPENTKVYERYYKVYQALYPAIKELYKEL